MTALTHKENELHNRLIVAEFNLKQVETELRRLRKENKKLRARLTEDESENWMQECADFWNRYIYINEMAQEKCEEQAKMWIEKLRDALPQREWQGLTEQDVLQIRAEWEVRDYRLSELCRAIEAKLKEKNSV